MIRGNAKPTGVCKGKKLNGPNKGEGKVMGRCCKSQPNVPSPISQWASGLERVQSIRDWGCAVTAARCVKRPVDRRREHGSKRTGRGGRRTIEVNENDLEVTKSLQRS
jgi:hypothetical protein